MKRWMIFIIVFIFTTASCGLKPQTTPRQPVALADFQTQAAKFKTIASGLQIASHSDDKQSANDIFTDDAEAADRTFGDHAVGPDQIMGLIAIVSAFGPTWESKQTDMYIGSGDGLVVAEMWNLKFGNIQFTQDHPMMEVDWLQARSEQISSWTIFYSLDTLEELNVPTSQRLEQARSLLSAYQFAWSSGDDQAVTELYTSDALRKDNIFMERQEGQKAIADFASSFFAWYPGVRWILSLGFGEGLGVAPMTGGLYTVKVQDLAGQPCEVKVAVLLQASESLITHETLYYEPQSLISCGWAR
jgi:hypothetical protein